MPNPDFSLTLRAVQIALGDNDNGALEWATEYGEPGYSQPRRGILLADWNRAEEAIARRLESRGMPQEQAENRARATWRALERRLESMDYSLEWSDEWVIDYNHGAKAYRTQPDSWDWEARIRVIDGDFLTPDDDAASWIADAMNEERRPLPSWFDDSELERHGFKVWEQEDKQVGFHPGQNETPDKFCPALREKGFDYVLQITSLGQFECRYRIWTRKEAERGILFDGASGVYIPQRFAREIDRSRVRGVSASDYEILEAGPDHEDYWEAWDEVLRMASLTLADGTRVELEQDGDLFYVEEGAEYCEPMDTYYVHK